MELEFDKEMDAILRRSGPDALRGVLVGDKPLDKPKHLDADAIAAFVENTIPAPTRRLYMEHFADCDRCRKLLSSSILMNGTAATAAAPAAVVVAAGEAIPWYQRLFRTPNLAIAMGALVLTFSGVLGYMMLQNRQDTSVAMAPAVEQESQRGPYADSDPSAMSGDVANVASNTAANIAAAPGANAVARSADETENKQLGRATAPSDSDRLSDTAAGKAEAPKEMTLDGVDAVREQPKLAKGEPPSAPVVTQSAPGLVGSVRADEERKEKDDSAKMSKRSTELSRTRDLPAAPAKSGPVRGAGPVQNQSNQINSQVFDMPVTRSVGGKTFDNRSGAWYDRAYRNQATTNYRRGTAEYKKLDSGLRSIADNLGGTVVLIWKAKAYRIN